MRTYKCLSSRQHYYYCMFDSNDGHRLMSSSSDERSRTDKEMKESPPFVTLIRHPETIANISHALQGATDSPWTVQGQHQAQRLADAIEKVCCNGFPKTEPLEWNVNGDVIRARSSPVSPLLRPGRRPTLLLSSPLGRTVALAKKIERALAMQAVATPQLVLRDGLAERNFGAREGTSYSRGQVKRALVDAKEVAALQAESSTCFHSRVRREFEYIQALLEEPQAKAENESILSPVPHIVIVTHGLWIRTFLHIALGNGVRLPFTDNTGIFTLALLDAPTRALAHRSGAAQGRYGLVCQNDISHLAGLKRQRGGIGSSASDARQQTLQQLWQTSKKAKCEATREKTP